jgi:translation initiation factor 2D
MFHKPNSCTTIGGGQKHAKDVPLRKSDRVALLQIVQSVVGSICGHTGEPSSTTPVVVVSQVRDDLVKDNVNTGSVLLLRDIFLNGALFKRSLKLPSANVINATLFLRSPNDNSAACIANSHNDKSNDGSGNSLGTTTITEWPYTQTLQCVWLQIEVERGVLHQLPSLALLSVLEMEQRPVVVHGNAAASMSPLSNSISQSPPPLLVVVTIHSAVSKFVCRGADLMRAGIVSSVVIPTPWHGTTTTTMTGTDTSRQGTKTANTTMVALVCVDGNPQPMAVGLLDGNLQSQLLTRSFDATASTTTGLFGPGTKGVGVTIVHAYGDDIWRQQVPLPSMSSSRTIPSSLSSREYDRGDYGNEGFHNGQWVGPLSQPLSVPMAPGPSTDEPVETMGETTAKACAPSDPENGSIPTLLEEDSTTALNHPSEHYDTNAAGETPINPSTIIESSSETTTDMADESTADSVPPSPLVIATPTTPDEILHHAVCRALAALSVKRDLPMVVATFYAQHVLPNRIEPIAIKQTSYKKFGTYLALQVQAGLLTVGPDDVNPSNPKHAPDAMGRLTDINRRHADLIPHLAAIKSQPPSIQPKSNGNNTRSRLVLADLYRIPQHWPAVLELDRDGVMAAHATSVERQGTGFLTLSEVRSILDQYVDANELVVLDSPAYVNLNGPLTDVLYKTKKKKDPDAPPPQAAPTRLLRKDLVAAWLSRLEPAYALVQVPGSTVITLGRGAPPQMVLTVSKRSGSKYITTVSGPFEVFQVEPNSLAKELSHRFACAASVGESSIGKGSVEVLLQGYLVDEVQALLLGDERLSGHGGVKDSPYQLPKGSIQVVLGKGVPVRKKRLVTGSSSTRK